MTCTNEQLRILMKYAITHNQSVAAAKAGMSLSSAKRYLRMRGRGKKPEKTPRSWRTREDPFREVWPVVREMLERDAGLEAKTLMVWLLEKYPGQFYPGQERTLRRRVHDWRVLEGPERREVMFPQNILPGRQSQSDYTHCNSLEVTIAGVPFPHMLFHFMLPYSRWEYVWICFTESFETLTTGYGRAVRALGYVAAEHRTDNLAAAVPIGERHVFQKRWEDFLKHFDSEPSANNPGCSNENGSVEKSHDLFKHAIDQRLRLRGSRDFANLEEYERFLDNAVMERNKQRAERLKEEVPFLKLLPANDWYEPRQYSATVSAWSTISVSGAVYSVPSRFIGQKLRVLADYESVKVYYGRHLLLQAPRRESGSKWINYRHVIFHLLRKPGAFRNYQFREELFPRLIFRHAYDALLRYNEDRADKEYLRILNQAALGSEDAVANALAQLLEADCPPTSEAVRPLCETPTAVPSIEVQEPSLDGYDTLLSFDLRKELKG
jgi:transposase